MSNNRAFLGLLNSVNSSLPSQEPDMVAPSGSPSNRDPDPRPYEPISPLCGKRDDPKRWAEYVASRLTYWMELRAWTARGEAALLDQAWEAALAAPPGSGFRPSTQVPPWLAYARKELEELEQWLRSEGQAEAVRLELDAAEARRWQDAQAEADELVPVLTEERFVLTRESARRAMLAMTEAERALSLAAQDNVRARRALLCSMIWLLGGFLAGAGPHLAAYPLLAACVHVAAVLCLGAGLISLVFVMKDSTKGRGR